VIETTQIGGRRSDRLTAGKLSPGNFGLLQQYRHEADLPKGLSVCPLLDQADMARSIVLIISAAFDPGCVKTHTSAKCKKCNSPVRHWPIWTQRDSTLTTRNRSQIFYARDRYGSFYTAKTPSGRHHL
jgi:hypothetical protein